jgi:transcriptional regulator with XRE-family HTH domain
MAVQTGFTDSSHMQNPELSDSRAYLQRVMEATKLDLTSIARKSGIDPATLTRPYNNKRWKTRISLKVLRKVAKETGVSLPPEMDPHPPEEPSATESDLALEIYETLPGPFSPEEKRRLVRQIVGVLRRRGLLA